MSDLPTFAPPVTPETKPFWDATAEGRLVLPRSRASPLRTTGARARPWCGCATGR